jgi:hypothetical protein
LRPIVVLLLPLLLLSCTREKETSDAPGYSVGGAEELESLLRRSFARADPEGVVLVVAWSVDHPPPGELEDLAGRWVRYGLVPVGVCIDLLLSEDRDDAISRVRGWERGHPSLFVGLIFDGDREELALRLPIRAPGLVLFNEHGKLLWSAEGFGRLEEVEAEIEKRLGLPSFAANGGG